MKYWVDKHIHVARHLYIKVRDSHVHCFIYRVNINKTILNLCDSSFSIPVFMDRTWYLVKRYLLISKFMFFSGFFVVFLFCLNLLLAVVNIHSLVIISFFWLGGAHEIHIICSFFLWFGGAHGIHIIWIFNGLVVPTKSTSIVVQRLILEFPVFG